MDTDTHTGDIFILYTCAQKYPDRRSLTVMHRHAQQIPYARARVYMHRNLPLSRDRRGAQKTGVFGKKKTLWKTSSTGAKR